MRNPVSPPFTGSGRNPLKANNEAENWPQLKNQVVMAESDKAAVETKGREDRKPAVLGPWQIDACAHARSLCKRWQPLS